MGKMTMQTILINQRQEIEQLLDALPEDTLTEVLNFLRYLNFKQNQAVAGPYQVVDKFEGLWASYSIDEEDIAAARQEMWGNFGQKVL
jgi:hypothetical protein